MRFLILVPLLVFLTSKTVLSQEIGNVYNFDTDCNNLQIINAEWLNQDDIIVALSSLRFVKYANKESKLMILNKDGLKIREKKIKDINDIENQTLLDFVTDDNKKRYFFITRNQLNDSISQVNLFITDDDFNLLRDTSFLNHSGEIVHRVKSRFDNKKNSFYGCGFSNKNPASFRGSAFYFNFSEDGSQNVAFIKQMEKPSQLLTSTDLIALDDGYIGSTINGHFKLFNKDFSKDSTVLMLDKNGGYSEGVNITINDNYLTLYGNYHYDNETENFKPTLSIFDINKNFDLIDSAYVGSDFLFPVEIRSMIYKDYSYYLGQDKIEVFGNAKNWHRHMRVVKYDNDLELLWEFEQTFPDDWYFFITGMAINDHDDVLVFGSTDQRFKNSNYYPFIYLLDKNGNLVNTIDLQEKEDKVSVFPNPSNGCFNINGVKSSSRYELFNMSGEPITKGFLSNSKLYLDISGCYVVRIYEERNIINKIILVK